MNDRLVAIMEYYEYSPSLFADEIGVIRSTISHIINGRNKPGVDILQKVLARFPELSADWLLTGHGKMFAQAKDEKKEEKEDSTNVNSLKSFAQLTLDDFARQPNKEENEITPIENLPGEKILNSSPEPEQILPEPDKEEILNTDKLVNEHPIDIKLKVESNKPMPIKRITVYYGDNTYMDFYADDNGK